MRKYTVGAVVLAATITTLVYAAEKPPKKTTGLSVEVPHLNNLGPQIGAMKDYDFRGRFITFAPGAAIAEHSHAERPGIVYVIQGEIVEFRNGERIEYAAGDSWIEDAKTVHWAKNPSNDTEAVIFMVDMPPKE